MLVVVSLGRIKGLSNSTNCSYRPLRSFSYCKPLQAVTPCELGEPHPHILFLSLLPWHACGRINYHFLARKMNPPISEIVGDPSPKSPLVDANAYNRNFNPHCRKNFVNQYVQMQFLI